MGWHPDRHCYKTQLAIAARDVTEAVRENSVRPCSRTTAPTRAPSGSEDVGAIPVVGEVAGIDRTSRVEAIAQCANPGHRSCRRPHGAVHGRSPLRNGCEWTSRRLSISAACRSRAVHMCATAQVAVHAADPTPAMTSSAIAATTSNTSTALHGVLNSLEVIALTSTHRRMAVLTERLQRPRHHSRSGLMASALAQTISWVETTGSTAPLRSTDTEFHDDLGLMLSSTSARNIRSASLFICVSYGLVGLDPVPVGHRKKKKKKSSTAITMGDAPDALDVVQLHRDIEIVPERLVPVREDEALRRRSGRRQC